MEPFSLSLKSLLPKKNLIFFEKKLSSHIRMAADEAIK